MKLDGLLEDGRAAGGFVLGPKAGLGEDAVTERRDLNGGETEKKQRDRQTYEAGEVWGQREYRETKGEGEEKRERVSHW